MGIFAGMNGIRIDKYLWAVRIFKSRSDAAEAVRSNRVLIGGGFIKPSRDVQVGDLLTVKKNHISYTYKVLDLVSNRQPAKNVPLYIHDQTTQDELDKLYRPRETIFVTRDKGTGRPTKRDRREIDNLMEELGAE